jgi:hypothetical protein
MQKISKMIVAVVLLSACGKSTKNVNAVSFPAGAKLAPLTPGFTQTSPNKPLSIELTFSGETLGINGLPFVPLNAGDPYFVDGWSLVINEYIVAVANITLNQNPTKDQIWADMGPQVASKAGPYVFDAHQAAGFVGKDGVEPANPMFIFNTQDDGTPFDSSQRYAFSYDTVAATYPAWNINLTTQGQADYDNMVTNGWDKFVSGTATYVGTGTYANPNDPNSAAAQANFAKLPTTVNFTIGWNDATSNTNCINADLGDETDLANRGVVVFPDKAAVAQITIHVDHLFWDTLEVEGEPLRFDPIAALAPADTSTTPFVLNSGLHQHLATVFQDGTPIPDRAPYQPNAGPNTSGQFTTDMPNNGVQVIMNVNGVTSVPDNYVDFMAFSVQSQPHLNAQGLCYIKGQHANDPYYTPNVH